MLTERIKGAFTFRKGVYAEVEQDPSFTQTAWILVAVVALLNQLGSFASGNILGWLIGAVVGTIFAVAGFAVGALVINWVGRTVFKAEVTFEELVRTLGLAYIWQVVGVLGIISAFSTTLSCVLAPIMVIATVLMIIAWFMAAKEALDLDWVQTIVTVILGWIALFVITSLAALILGILGFGTAALFGGIGG
ncbi:MAG: YIP1 family protein [Anaerolineales bacterium]